MSLWATKRKLIYLGIPILTLVILLTAFFFLIFYKKPTCFDGKKNSDETGIDCGGSCVILCTAETLDPIVHWSRVFRVTGNIYNAVAYIENPNINSDAFNVPYSFKIYDSKDKTRLLLKRDGIAFIPKNKIFAIFEGPIDFSSSTPALQSDFQFTGKPVWIKDNNTLPEIIIKDQSLSNENKAPRIDATVSNNSLYPVSNIEVIAIVYEDKDRAIGASRTLVNTIPSAKSASIVFTWPKPFEVGQESCTVPVDVMLAVDRSGSMAYVSKKPPQPLTDVKLAAENFIGKLGDIDRAGIVSFGTTASDPIDQTLTFDKTVIKNIIKNISIGGVGNQNTNIGDALLKAQNELVSSQRVVSSTPVVVLLTDGEATDPQKKGDVNYPSNYALDIASSTRSNNISIYSIGLGNKVNNDFLTGISGSKDRYFNAPTPADLNNIYTKIANSICKKTPKIVEIISRILPAN